MTRQTNHIIRYVSVAAVFCLICVIYLGRLLFIQLNYAEDAESNTTKRTVTVQAVRGEIYDRNGNALVTNRYTYDLTLSYATFAASGLKASNEACLHMVDALKNSNEEEKHEEKYFPFDGAYPYYTLSEAATDAETSVAYRYQRVLKTIGLKEDAKSSDVVKYYVTTYDLLATDGSGERLFDDDEIDRLIRIRYDMDAVGF